MGAIASSAESAPQAVIMISVVGRSAVNKKGRYRRGSQKKDNTGGEDRFFRKVRAAVRYHDFIVGRSG